MEFFAATGEDDDSIDTSNLPAKQASWELSPQASRSMGVPGAHLQRAAANFNSFDLNSEAPNYGSFTQLVLSPSIPNPDLEFGAGRRGKVAGQHSVSPSHAAAPQKSCRVDTTSVARNPITMGAHGGHHRSVASLCGAKASRLHPEIGSKHGNLGVGASSNVTAPSLADTDHAQDMEDEVVIDAFSVSVFYPILINVQPQNSLHIVVVYCSIIYLQLFSLFYFLFNSTLEWGAL
jgi:hypothetical protein